MLTGPSLSALGHRHRPPPFATVSQTARLAHPGLVALTSGLAALPTLVTLALRGDDLFGPVVLASLVAGAAVGWAVDDPVAELLGSTPTGTPVRVAIRIVAAALVACASLGLLLAVVATGPGLPPHTGDRAPEAAAAAGAALATGLLAARRGERAAGSAAVTAGLLATALVAGMSIRFTQLPSFLPGPSHSRWWLMVIVALAVGLHAGRDPASR